MATHFQNVQVIINPASGSDEPILNPINDVFAQHGIKWDARVTHGPGDATRLTTEALDAGADLIVSYGGDGTLMEVINGLVGHKVPLALLPGGTGNGVATEVKIPNDLRQALQLIVDDPERRKLDVGRCDKHYFIQRAFIGLPDDFMPPRELKNSIGFMAYPIYAMRFLRERAPVRYRLTIDGQEYDEEAILCLVNNVGYSNSDRLRDMVERNFLDVQIHQGDVVITAEENVLNTINPEDGLFDVLLVTVKPSLLRSLVSLAIRGEDNALAQVRVIQGREIVIKATPNQVIKLDGEEGGHTPSRLELIPQAIEIIVPSNHT